MNARTFWRTALAGLLLLLGAAACEKELPHAHDPESHYANTYAELFDQFWDTMNNRYLFWDHDSTDWDAVHDHYRPLFAQLDITKPADQRKSVQYFNDMLAGLEDGHFYLGFRAPAVADSFVQPRLWQLLHHRIPSFDRAESQRTPAYYSYTYYDLDAAHYLDPGSLVGVYHSPDSVYVSVLQGTIHGNVLYLGFSAEQLSTAMADAGTNLLKTAYTTFRQACRTRPGLKGVVLDMRGSGGGDPHDAVVLAADLITQPLLRGSTRSKSGPGRLDYTPWAASYIQPAAGGQPLTVPLVVLTDLITFSAGEDIVTALKAMPEANVKTVGTTTLGGTTGFGRSNKALHGKGYVEFASGQGQFLFVGLSPFNFRAADGQEYPLGLPPDYEVPFDTAAIRAGRDPQLEKALTLLP